MSSQQMVEMRSPVTNRERREGAKHVACTEMRKMQHNSMLIESSWTTEWRIDSAGRRGDPRMRECGGRVSPLAPDLPPAHKRVKKQSCLHTRLTTGRTEEADAPKITRANECGTLTDRAMSSRRVKRSLTVRDGGGFFVEERSMQPSSPLLRAGTFEKSVSRAPYSLANGRYLY
jgi:hypothetical protein